MTPAPQASEWHKEDEVQALLDIWFQYENSDTSQDGK